MLTVKVKVVGIIKNKKKTNLGTLWTTLFQLNMLPGSQFTVTGRQKHINRPRQPSPLYAIVAPRLFAGRVLIGASLCLWAFIPWFISHPGWEILLPCNFQHLGRSWCSFNDLWGPEPAEGKSRMTPPGSRTFGTEVWAGCLCAPSATCCMVPKPILQSVSDERWFGQVGVSIQLPFFHLFFLVCGYPPISTWRP